jgi:hypothetical protein
MLTLGSRELAERLRDDHQRLLGEAHHREEERMTFNICGARLKDKNMPERMSKVHPGGH